MVKKPEIYRGCRHGIDEHRTIARAGIQRAMDDAAGIKRLSEDDVAAVIYTKLR